jgi:general secretion pathway protein A
MYATYFGLAELPFAMTPDPRFVYLSGRHQEALAHLLYGVGEGGGFVQLTGEVGTGKTTLSRILLEQLPPGVDAAVILNPRLTDVELLGAVCDELRLAYPAGTASLKVLVDTLHHHLLEAHARGRRTVLIIDEAQDLEPEVLEQIRLLTNLETPRDKLLQIILIGQPELIRLLERQDLRQVAQRITARYHLTPFDARDTRAYVRHRLKVAGGRRNLFTRAALWRLHRAARGVPRLINAIGDRALLGAYTQEQFRVGATTVHRAAREVLGRRAASRRAPWAAVVAAGLLVTAGALAWLGPERIGVARAWTTAWAGWRLPRVPAAPATPAATPSASSDAVSTPATGPSAPPTSVPAPSSTAPEPPASASARSASTSGAAPATAAAPLATTSASADVRSASPSTTPVSGSEPERAVQLAGLLTDPSVKADKPAAFTSLFARWRISFDSSNGALACERGRVEGLVCLFRTGTWTRVRRLDRPAIVELVAPGGQRRYATVVGLDEDTATLDVGGRRYVFPLSEIDRYWEGTFIMLWKGPAQPMSVGSRGKDVEWLRLRIAEADGAPPGGPQSDVFDEALRARVIALQRSKGLEADGVVGENTLIHLTSRDPDVPRLGRPGTS